MDNVNVIQVPSSKDRSKGFIVSAHTFWHIKNYNDTGSKVALDNILKKLEEKLGLREREDIHNSAIELGQYCEDKIVQELANKHKTKGYTYFAEPSIIIDGFGGYVDLLKVKLTDENKADITAPQNEIFEVKTITTQKRWDEVCKAADPAHIAQLSTYLYQSKINKGQIVYFNAAQQGETNPADSLAHKDNLNFTFDKDSKNYKVYKIKLDGKGKVTATKIVEPYLKSSEDVTLSVEDFTNWVKSNTLPDFYNTKLETQYADFFTQYDNIQDQINGINANIKVLEKQKEQLKQQLKLADKEIINLLSASNKEMVVTTNHILRLPGFKKSFDSTAFQKAHKEEYDKCKKTKKTFDAKLVEKNFPELYSQFTVDKPDGRVKIMTGRKDAN